MWDSLDRNGDRAALVSRSSSEGGGGDRFDLIIASDCLFFKVKSYFTSRRGLVGSDCLLLVLISDLVRWCFPGTGVCYWEKARATIKRHSIAQLAPWT